MLTSIDSVPEAFTAQLAAADLDSDYMKLGSEFMRLGWRIGKPLRLIGWLLADWMSLMERANNNLDAPVDCPLESCAGCVLDALIGQFEAVMKDTPSKLAGSTLDALHELKARRPAHNPLHSRASG